MKVVHCKIDKNYDIYIGRGKDPKTGKEGKWGNPFIIGRDGKRKDVVEKYRQYILKTPELMNSLWELHGKTLACWCAPLLCHGHILAELVSKHVSEDSYTVFCNTCAREIDHTLNGKPACSEGHVNL